MKRAECETNLNGALKRRKYVFKFPKSEFQCPSFLPQATAPSEGGKVGLSLGPRQCPPRGRSPFLALALPALSISLSRDSSMR